MGRADVVTACRDSASKPRCVDHVDDFDFETEPDAMIDHLTEWLAGWGHPNCDPI